MNSEYQRVPPHDIEAESVVLGSMILAADCIPLVGEAMDKDDFYRPAHQILYGVLATMYAAGEPVDLVTVRATLLTARKLEAVGGIEYVADLVEGVPNAANAEFYAGIVRDKARLRRIITDANAVVRMAYEAAESAEDVLTEWQRRAFDIQTKRRGWGHISDWTGQVVQESQEPNRGLSLGIREFDEATGGLRPGNYMVVGARTGRGKTTVAMNITTRLATQNRGVIYFSREMPGPELAARVLCSQAEVSGLRVRMGDCHDHQRDALARAKVQLDDLPLWVDSKATTVHEIAARVRHITATHGKPALVVIDYLQLLTGDGGSLREIFTTISHKLKQLFLDLEIPGIVLSQMRRPANGQESEKPRITGLKETGDIENDSDMILLLHMDNMPDPVGENTMLCCLGKNRHGPQLGYPDETTGHSISLVWEPRYTRIRLA